MSFVKDAVCGDTVAPDQSMGSGGKFHSPTANIVNRTSDNIKSSLKRDTMGGGRPPMPAEKRIFPQSSQSMREPKATDATTVDRTNLDDGSKQSTNTEQPQPPVDRGLLNR